MSNDLLTGIAGLGVGYMLGQKEKEVATTTTPSERETKLITQLDTARNTVALLLTQHAELEAELEAYKAGASETDAAMVIILQDALTKARQKINDLIAYIADVTGNTALASYIPPIAGKVPGFVISPDLVFDGATNDDPNLYYDSTGCIAVRGLQSLDVQLDLVQRGTATTITRVKSTAAPISTPITMNLKGNVETNTFVSNTPAGGRAGKAGDAVSRTLRPFPTYLLEFAPSTDFLAISHLLRFCSRFHNSTPTDNNWQDAGNRTYTLQNSVVAFYRKNVLAIRPMHGLTGMNTVAGYPANFNIWADLDKVVQLKSMCAVQAPLSVSFGIFREEYAQYPFLEAEAKLTGAPM